MDRDDQLQDIAWPDANDIDVREYWNVLRRRRRIVGTVFGLVVLTVVIGTLATSPSYEALTVLQIEPDTPTLLDFESMFQMDATGDAFYQTQYKLLESRTLASRVIDELGLMEARKQDSTGSLSAVVGAALSAPRWVLSTARGLFAEPMDSSDQAQAEEDAERVSAVGWFLGRLTVSPVRNTRLVEVRWRSESPVQAANVARAVAENYIAANLEAKFETTQIASAFLAREVEQLQTSIGEAQAELQRYGSERNILSDSERQDGVSQQLVQLNQELTRARAERISRQAKYDSIRNAAPSSIAEVRASRVVSTLKEDRGDLRRQETQMSRRFTDDWPELQQLRAQIDDLDIRIAEEERSVYDAVVREAFADFQAGLDRENGIDRLLADATAQATVLNQNLIEYRSLQTEIDSGRQILETLLSRQSETGVSARLQGRQTSNIRVVDEATIPAAPSSPNARLNLILGIIVGLMLGVGVAFVQEFLDNTLKDAEDVERHLDLPNLALIPSIQSARQGTGYGYGYGYGSEAEDLPAHVTIETIVFDHPRSSLAEAYRSLRTAVLLSRAGQPPQVIAVTSATPGEGKTTTSTNLAQTLAQAGKKTLLLDGDLRKPRIHSIFGLPEGTGLVSYLTGAKELQAAVLETRVPNLWVTPCGPLPPNPSELLGARELADLLVSLRATFDAIIIDTPPVMAVVDPLEIAALADGVVVVVRGNDTPYQVVSRAIRKLQDVSASLLGVVLNGVDLRSGAYYSGYKRPGGARGAGDSRSKAIA